MARDRDQPEQGATEEEEQIVRSLAHGVAEAFVGYLRGDLEFDELTFEMFDTLQAVHAVVTGNYTVEMIEEDEPPTEAPKRGGGRRRR